MRPEECIVVSRYPGFHEWVVKAGIVPPGTPRQEDLNRDRVHGKIVVGPVPPPLAVFAKAVIHIPVIRPRDAGIGPLTVKDCERYALTPLIYQARRIEHAECPSLAEQARLALGELRRLGGHEAITRGLDAAIRGVKEAA